VIVDIHLYRFRSYEDAAFELSPNVNIIVGPNTSGKTNLLEAILVISKGSSYRANDNELIQTGYTAAKLETHTETGSRTVKIIASVQPSKKTFEINGKRYTRLDLQKTLPVVLFEPNHLIQLIGSPDARRNYIDDLLEQTIRGFAALRSQYRRTLAQRNALLKKQPLSTPPQLFAWDVRLSELGGKIVRLRTELIETINNDLPATYRELSNHQTTIHLAYQSACNQTQYETDMLRHLESSLESDSRRGYTTSGPHRDDIVIVLHDQPLQHTASRGETRTALLALKIIEARRIENARNQAPILLLDDVFSELDGSRRLSLTKFLQSYQTFITTTDADVALRQFTERANIIPLTANM
jgi:DNA replication and repair protein RecF